MVGDDDDDDLGRIIEFDRGGAGLSYQLSVLERKREAQRKVGGQHRNICREEVSQKVQCHSTYPYRHFHRQNANFQHRISQLTSRSVITISVS